MSADFDEFYAALEAKNADLKKRSQVVQGVFAQQEEEAKKLITAQQTANDNNLLVRGAQEMVGLATQEKVQTLATKMGINPGESSEVLDKIAEEWKGATLDSIEKRNNLKDALEKKFFDAPLDYIKTQINMENTVQQAEAAAARRGEATQSLISVQTMTQNMPAQMAALAKTKTQATIDASLTAVRAELDGKLSALKINNFGMQTDNLLKLNQLDATQLNYASSKLQAENQEAQIAQTREQFALQKQEFNLRLEDRAERIATKKADRQELEDMANLVRKGAAVAGFEDVAAFPTAKIIQRLNMKDGATMDFLKAGMTSETLGHPVLSDSPGEVARILAVNSAPLRPEQKPLKEFFNSIWNKAGTVEAGRVGQYDNTKISDVTKAAGNLAVKEAVAQMSNIKNGDNTNIYAPPPLPSILEVPAVKNSKWFGAVMANQAVTGELKEFNPQQLKDLTVAAIKAGKIDFKEAQSGLRTVFGAALLVNNATKNYSGLGLPNQKSYSTEIKTAKFGFSKHYELTNDADVGTMLMKSLSDIDDRNPIGANNTFK